MKVGLIDVDGHNFPNLALMRISEYHKERGDTVEWWWSDFEHFDIVYMSKVFSDAYTPDKPEPMNADKVIKGGTGYAISLANGREVYDSEKDHTLPPEIERMRPDYSIYQKYDFAVSMTSRGCPRGCSFCHVAAKEGRKAVKVADVADFYAGQKLIKVLDPNITACPDRDELMAQYEETGAWIDFTQGLDARLLDSDFIDRMNRLKIRNLHFAWDGMAQSDAVLRWLKLYRKCGKIQDHRRLSVYCLTNYDTTHDEDLYRVNTLRDLGYDPYVMIYEKPTAPRETRLLQRWCNNKIIFNTVGFDEYDSKIG